MICGSIPRKETIASTIRRWLRSQTTSDGGCMTGWFEPGIRSLTGRVPQGVGTFVNTVDQVSASDPTTPPSSTQHHTLAAASERYCPVGLKQGQIGPRRQRSVSSKRGVIASFLRESMRGTSGRGRRHLQSGQKWAVWLRLLTREEPDG